MTNPGSAIRKLVVGVVGLVSLVVGCGVDEGEKVDASLVPEGDAFRPVAQVVIERCGSLDCHGSKYRNMRLVGFGTTRLDPSHRPDAPETTAAEVQANYDAVVALEPDLLREVAAEGGARPERLTFIRKSRNIEDHKGGQRIVVGDEADRCILSWLKNEVDPAVCKAAVPRLAEL
jgi:hypothetical protein